MNDEIVFTAEGKKKIEEELEHRIMVVRPKIVERIKIARSFGDLSENSEYSSAKDEQATNETEIKKLQKQLQLGRIIDVSEIPDDEVSLGRSVSFVEDGDDEEETYAIVGAAEADPFAGKISNESPIAKALIGKKVGDKASIETPGGAMDVTITKVN